MKRYLIIMSVLFVITDILHAQQEKFMALFTYNFTKLIDWPANSNTVFNIGIMDNNALYDEANSILSNKSVNNIPFKVVKLVNVKGPDNCQVIIFDPTEKETMKTIIEKYKNKPVLLVASRAGACSDGADICFTVKNGNLNYEVSETNIGNRPLTVSGQLYRLGTKVD